MEDGVEKYLLEFENEHLLLSDLLINPRRPTQK